jgi:hypothetical protein
MQDPNRDMDLRNLEEQPPGYEEIPRTYHASTVPLEPSFDAVGMEYHNM